MSNFNGWACSIAIMAYAVARLVFLLGRLRERRWWVRTAESMSCQAVIVDGKRYTAIRLADDDIEFEDEGRDLFPRKDR